MSVLKLVLTADNHLSRYYDRMPPARLEERRRWLRQGFHKAVEFAIDHQADLFVQAGDLFDTPDPRNLEREFVAMELSLLRQHGVRCYGIGGNHDTPKQRTEHGGYLPQGVYAQVGAMGLFPDSASITVSRLEVRNMTVEIGGMTWNPALPPQSDPLQGVQWPASDGEPQIRILVMHHCIEGHLYPGANDPVVTLDSISRLEGVDCVLLGHVHLPKQLYVGGRLVVVPGATEKMTFGEGEGEPGFVYLELAPGGVEECDRVGVSHQPREELLIRTTELDGHEPAALILQRLEPHCALDTMIKLKLEGPVTREGYQALDLRRVWEHGANHAFFFDLDTTGLYIEDETHQVAERGVRFSQREEIQLYAQELMAGAESPEERELFLEAMNSLLTYYERQE